jgi:hypothetical protein
LAALRTYAVVRDGDPPLLVFLEALERVLRHGLKRARLPRRGWGRIAHRP